MNKQGKRLKGAAAASIVTVGIAMGAVPVGGGGSGVANAANPNNCDDFAAALFLKGVDLFHKVELFLKDSGVESGFQKTGLNVGGFYHVATGAGEIFLKNDVQGTTPGVSFCALDVNGASRGFFDTDGTIDQSQTSFSSVDDKQAFLKVQLTDVIITSSFQVSPEDFTVTIKVDKSTP